MEPGDIGVFKAGIGCIYQLAKLILNNFYKFDCSAPAVTEGKEEEEVQQEEDDDEIGVFQADGEYILATSLDRETITAPSIPRSVY
ncbi:MAG: hypothetical protein EZS28_022938 [Streblomastix strix]|uniref:Uncharacterized protein n=1 Tax=Streblomastix strix TaxID=222440 RepID=A0A5J4VGR5_9EUKA|nr:MAG: hypothetical protein EZS28_022938 [Streblomastix strix]